MTAAERAHLLRQTGVCRRLAARESRVGNRERRDFWVTLARRNIARIRQR